MTQFFKKITLFLGYIHAVPPTLVGMLLAAVLLKFKWRWKNGAIEVLDWKSKYSVATTFGFLIFVNNDYADEVAVAEHERRHVLQYMWLGILFFPVYGLASALASRLGGHYYYDNWFEKDARNNPTKLI